MSTEFVEVRGPKPVALISNHHILNLPIPKASTSEAFHTYKKYFVTKLHVHTYIHHVRQDASEVDGRATRGCMDWIISLPRRRSHLSSLGSMKIIFKLYDGSAPRMHPPEPLTWRGRASPKISLTRPGDFRVQSTGTYVGT